MAHLAQRQFFDFVRTKHPDYFRDRVVLECGSYNINGTLRDFFTGCFYVGTDIKAGPAVDVVWPAHLMPRNLDGVFDAVVSGEMLEHSEYWRADLLAMHRVCRSGGLIVLSMAGIGRAVHGLEHSASGDYYRNISVDDLRSVLSPDMFTESHYEHNPNGWEGGGDTYFYGVKK